MKKFLAVALALVLSAATTSDVKAQSVSAGSLVAQAKKQHLDCDHVQVIDGYLHVLSCGGLAVAPRVGYTRFEYENEQGNGSTSGIEYGVDVSYRTIVAKQLAVRPTLYATASTSMTFEGQDVKSLEAGFDLPIEVYIHHKNNVGADCPNKIWFGVGPSVAYHNIKSEKIIDTEEYLLTIPAQSNVFLIGGIAEINFHLGSLRNVKKITAGDRLYRVTKHHPIRLSLGGKYMVGTFHKPAEGKMDIEKISAYARLSINL